jgi:rhomboid family protein
MGFQDRDYYREETQATGVQSIVIKLIIINSVLFLADMFFGGENHKITSALMLQGDALAHPLMWYQFLTAGFVHQPADVWHGQSGNFWHIFGNMLGLFVFGRPLEERFGPRSFLRFYLTAIVLSLLAWGVRNYFFGGGSGSCMGASGGVTATAILFCLIYPHAKLLLFFAIPTPAWVFAILLVAMDVFGVKMPGQQGNVAFEAHLAGATFALAYWYFGWNFGRLPGLDELGRLFSSRPKWFKPRPPLKVHDPERYYEDLDAEADRLLDKVAREGLSSLNDQERRVLEDYSRRTRQKLR